MKDRILFFILMLGTWFLLTWSFDVQNVVTGIVIALGCTVFFSHLFFTPATWLLHPRRILWFLYYLPVFFLHMIRANLDVAYRVLHRDVPIHPGIVRVRTSLTSDIALTMLANSITLTPGTLTVDIDDGYMYIHWINVTTFDPEQQTMLIVSRFERILRRVFE